DLGLPLRGADRVGQVRVDQIELGVAPREACQQRAARLAGRAAPGEAELTCGEDRQPGERGVTTALGAGLDRRAELHREAELVAERLRLIADAAARAMDIYFLKCQHIRIERADRGGDPVEVDREVGATTELDVVRQDAQRVHIRRIESESRASA